jgi:hypothetical protein
MVGIFNNFKKGITMIFLAWAIMIAIVVRMTAKMLANYDN